MFTITLNPRIGQKINSMYYYLANILKQKITVRSREDKCKAETTKKANIS